MKTSTLRVILPNFREEKYQSTGNVSINSHRNATLSIYQTKVIVMMDIVEFLNDKKSPDTLKLPD